MMPVTVALALLVCGNCTKGGLKGVSSGSRPPLYSASLIQEVSGAN
jgi:hypothetical protein